TGPIHNPWMSAPCEQELPPPPHLHATRATSMSQTHGRQASSRGFRRQGERSCMPDNSRIFILQELTLISFGSNISVAMEPTAKSVILDLLSTIGERSMPVRALVAAADFFGIEENSLRVALARLLAADTVERDERGAYRLGRRAAAVQRQVRSWRRI